MSIFEKIFGPAGSVEQPGQDEEMLVRPIIEPEDEGTETEGNYTRIKFVGTEEEHKKFNLTLDKKLDEYRTRAVNSAERSSPDDVRTHLDSRCKLLIGVILRGEGEVNYNVMLERLKKEQGDLFDQDIFDNAWRVIGQYANNGEDLVGGGTGFTQKRG